jgi:hypothetical protein
VNQAAKKLVGKPVERDVLLPTPEHDRPFVLPAWAVLGKETRPVVRVAADIAASLLLKTADASSRHYPLDGVDALTHDAGMVIADGDDESMQPVRFDRDVTVAEVQPESKYE